MEGPYFLTKSASLSAVRWFLVVLLSVAMPGCGLFDSGTEWKSGPYELTWVDAYENMSLYYTIHDGGIGRVSATVFAVGADSRYVVAKRHPDGNRSITQYYVVDMAKDSMYKDKLDVVLGPYTEAEYRVKVALLGLPAFSKVIRSLE